MEISIYMYDMTTLYIIMCLIQYDTLIVKPFNAPTLYVKYNI